MTKSVKIRGDDATIRAGGSAGVVGFQAAFLIDPHRLDGGGHRVRDDPVREPHNPAIRALNSGDLRILECEIDGIVPSSLGARTGALGIDLRGGPFGDVTIVDNRLRIGGTGDDTTGGIAIAGSATSVMIGQRPLFEMLGAPADARRHALLEGRHIPERPAIIREDDRGPGSARRPRQPVGGAHGAIPFDHPRIDLGRCVVEDGGPASRRMPSGARRTGGLGKPHGAHHVARRKRARAGRSFEALRQATEESRPPSDAAPRVCHSSGCALPAVAIDGKVAFSRRDGAGRA